MNPLLPVSLDFENPTPEELLSKNQQSSEQLVSQASLPSPFSSVVPKIIIRKSQRKAKAKKPGLPTVQMTAGSLKVTLLA
jgi:hypothetical protein